MALNIDEIIRTLGLKPHPKEGGYYVETYRSGEVIPSQALSPRYAAGKHFSTAIYYLLTPGDFSPIHRIISDEIYHFYIGDPVTMLQLYTDGSGEVITIGTDILNGHQPQVVVLRETWQGAMLQEGGRFALMGTTVAPAFDFPDYEEPGRQDILDQYPTYRDLIVRLTRK